MFRLAVVYRSELRFGEFAHLIKHSHNCLAQSDPQESVNIQSIKNRIHNMTIRLYTQDSRNVTSWCLGDITFQIIRELHSPDLIGRPTAPSQISSCINFSLGSVEVFSGKNPLARLL